MTPDPSMPQATLVRMVREHHVCPWGLKALDLLERTNFDVDDRHLETSDEVAAFKAEHQVQTTPQIWIGETRVGGYEDLLRHLGREVPDPDRLTYRPVATLFAVAMGLAVAMHYAGFGLLGFEVLPTFAAISMVLLAQQKLRDVESFSTMFLGYDLLARRWVRYAYLYPYAEALAGLLMLAGLLPFLSGPLALFIGTVGAASVFKAVYLDKRELKCACVGGSSNVPLGFVSLTENLVMVAMGLWTLGRLL
jgi:glutaredoxin